MRNLTQGWKPVFAAVFLFLSAGYAEPAATPNAADVINQTRHDPSVGATELSQATAGAARGGAQAAATVIQDGALTYRVGQGLNNTEGPSEVKSTKDDKFITATVRHRNPDGTYSDVEVQVARSASNSGKVIMEQHPCEFMFGGFDCSSGNCIQLRNGFDQSMVNRFFNAMDYMGQDFTGPAVCVPAKNDEEGTAQCGRQNKKAINPVNPQYWNNNDVQDYIAMSKIMQSDLKPERDKNPYGFYFCVPKGNNLNSKEQMCTLSGVQNSNWPGKEAITHVYWQREGTGANRDGNCMCNNPEGGADIVCQPTLARVDPCNHDGMTRDNRPAAQRSQDLRCKCPQPDRDGHDFYVLPDNFAGCAIAAQPLNPDPDANHAPPPTEASRELRECLQQLKDAGEACKRDADAAKEACTNSDETGAGGSFNGLAAINNSSLRGTGAQDTCFKASLMATAASEVVGSSSSKCADGANACNASCGADRFSTKKEQCRHDISPGNPLDQPYFDNYQYMASAESNFTDGTRICQDDVPKGKSTLESLFDGLGKSLQDSVKCACQLSVTGTTSGTNCSSIPPVADCNSNPTLAGCNVYTGLGACAQGTPTYNAQLCACQMDANASGCAPGPGNGSLTGIASDAAKSAALIAAGATSLPMQGGSSIAALKGGAIDMSGISGNGPQDTAITAGASGPGGVALSGGGVGGRGGGSSLNGDAGGTTEGGEGEKKGLSALFGQVKNGIASALGLKSKTNPDSKDAKKVSKVDMSKYRPGRDPASSKTFGQKNKDIWKMMNNCVQGDSCPSNMNNYLLSP